ncbi:drug/metabolite transporter (DMT)-like permease [Chitinivorax tropicus]|uniref:Drug/metabolite transporter (DMT)-like permease n=2 Tax=Chitinivorax tropicus TaxID=714531 RepID=A0A840MU84_9PROT|nr:drug/metabolite transporter (DMT)-like permease [Chitinivorax tropicus]
MYVFCLLAWGLNFIAIRLQGHAVPVEWSLVYRLAIGAVLFCCLIAWMQPKSRLKRHDISSVLAFGFFNFAASYLALYHATKLISAPLVTLIFSMKTISTPIFLRIFLKQRLHKALLIGGLIGVAGVGVLIYPMLSQGASASALPGMFYAVSGTLLTSMGDVYSARNAKNEVNPVQANALGLCFASALVALYAYSQGLTPTFAHTPSYIGALLYLTVIATCAAWLFYLQLVARLGAAQSGYMVAFFPVIGGVASVLIGESTLTAHLVFSCILTCTGALVALSGGSSGSRKMATQPDQLSR